MEIKGRIIHVLPLQEGVSKAGNPWKKQEYVLETEEQYPRKVCFNLFGDKVDQYPAAIGEDVVVSFDLESREFNESLVHRCESLEDRKVGSCCSGSSRYASDAQRYSSVPTGSGSSRFGAFSYR